MSLSKWDNTTLLGFWIFSCVDLELIHPLDLYDHSISREKKYQIFFLFFIKSNQMTVWTFNSLVSWHYCQNETTFCFFWGLNVFLGWLGTGSSSRSLWSFNFIALTSVLASFCAFLGQSLFKCSTLPQNRHPPPLERKGKLIH